MGRPSVEVALARSRQVVGSGYIGEYPEEALGVLTYAWGNPFSISSNYARCNAIAVAFAASMGWLSNIAPDGRSFSRLWHVTAEGLLVLRHLEPN